MAESTISDSFFCGEFFFLVILLSAEWLKTSCTGKKRKKKREGYLLVLYPVNPSTFPGAFQCYLVKNLLLPYPSSWPSWGGVFCAVSQVSVPGQRWPLCWVQGSMGAVFPVRPLFPGTRLSLGETRGENNNWGGQISSSGVSFPLVTNAVSQSTLA